MRKLFSFIIIVSLLSCNKDVDNSSGTRIYRIWQNNILATEFNYDAEGRIVRVNMGRDAHPFSETVFLYDNNGRLIRQNNAVNVSSSSTAVRMDSSFFEFSYDANGRIAEARTYRLAKGTVIYASRTVPDYDNQGRVIAKTIYDTAGKAATKTTFQYNSDDNIIVQDIYSFNNGAPVLNLHSTYEYDRYNNPYKGKWVEPFGISRNNITKGSETGYSSGPSSFTIEYKKYNKNGYPLLTNENGTECVYEYK
jgi:hypothetical protein